MAGHLPHRAVYFEPYPPVRPANVRCPVIVRVGMLLVLHHARLLEQRAKLLAAARVEVAEFHTRLPLNQILKDRMIFPVRQFTIEYSIESVAAKRCHRKTKSPFIIEPV